MKFLLNICRILIGLVFIFSGFVKGIDPLGSDYKFTDYFNAFGMSWMNFSALFFSFLLSMAEFIIGICLFLNIKTKLASWGALLFMAVFTPLTLILAIKNPVTDCGCFGDALVLTNWETFFKNIILLVMVLLVFFNRNRFKSIFNVLEQSVILTGSIIFMFCIEMYSYRHLPILDFRPYAVGANITEGMTIPEGAPHDEYSTTLKYKNKNTGEIKEFDESNFPWQDTLNWEFHSSSQKLLKEGYKAPIHDFVIEHPEYGDITEEVLNDDDYTFLVVSYKLSKASAEAQDKLNKLAAYASENGYRFYGLTASNADEITDFVHKYNVNYSFCATDEIQLKTVIRSNPGLVLLKKGTIIDKWGHRDIPDADELKGKDPLSFCLLEQQYITDRYVIYSLALLYIFLLAFYMIKKYKRLAK
ncbi:BT_3928 family protein [uncultured Culturomica sp.]|uniref:BT_3928 family protein n=1 Tax=uncultured Culturomica sp. TaxID=1926654 RepID=UPI00033CDCAC|nr:BT_3928 family protein [uncultured Culturomica sp.]CCZ06788.1 doxX family protein [Odoribacter sp. CAG:788]